MSAESSEESLAESAEAGTASPPLKLIHAGCAFLLALAWIAIVAGYSRLTDGGPRPEPDDLLALTLGALIGVLPLAWLGLSVWRNRAGFRAWSVGRSVLQAARIAVQPLPWLVAIGFLVVIALPYFADHMVRMKLSEMFITSSGLRTSIAEQAHANKTLVGAGADLSVQPVGRVTTGLVGRDGVILVYGDEFRMLIALVPEMKGDVVEWACDAMPKKFFPSACRDRQPETSYAERRSGSPREDAAELLEWGARWQQEVVTSSTTRGTLEGSAKTTVIRREGLLDFGLLDSSGRIALYSDRHGTFVLLEPALKDAQVTWRCRIWPAKAAAPGCAPAP